MMRCLVMLAPALAHLLFCAHLLYQGAPLWVAALPLAGLPLLAMRQRGVAVLQTLVLGGYALEWVRTTWVLTTARLAAGVSIHPALEILSGAKLVDQKPTKSITLRLRRDIKGGYFYDVALHRLRCPALWRFRQHDSSLGSQGDHSQVDSHVRRSSLLSDARTGIIRSSAYARRLCSSVVPRLGIRFATSNRTFEGCRL